MTNTVENPKGNEARRIIDALNGVPEEKREFVAILGVAFISGFDSATTLQGAEAIARKPTR